MSTPGLPDDPSVIDINLALLSANDAAALRELTEQLRSVSEHLASFQQTSYEGPARASRGRTGRSGVTERIVGGPSVGGEQNRGEGPQHSGPALGENASVPPETPRGDVPQAPQGWRLDEVETDGRQDPYDQPFRQQLANAWRESSTHPSRGQPGYGRVGTFLDSLNRQRVPTQSAQTSPSGQPSPTASVSGGRGYTIPRGDQPGVEDGMGGPPPATPGFRNPDDPMYNVPREGLRQPITMPQHYGGVWTGQDYLSMASNMFARDYIRRADRGEGTVGGTTAQGDPTGASQVWRARAANTLGGAAQGYGQFHAAVGMGRRLLNRIDLGYSLRPGDVERTGEELGFERGQNDIGVDGFGFRTPGDQYTSEAGMEGLRSRRLITDLATEPLINKEQAGQMVGVLQGMGWSGEQRDTMAYTSMAPLMKQGQNPEVLGPMMDRAVRYGTGSLQEFNEAMNHIGETARGARMPLDEFEQAMGEFAETASQTGSTYVQGLQSARRFSTTTGMDPRFGSELMQNDFVQSLGMTRTGLLPSQQGLLGGQQTAQLALEGTDMAMRMTQGFHRTTRVPIDPNDPDGPKQTIDPLDAHYAQAAALMGIPVDRFRQMRRRRNRIRSSGRAESALQEFGRETRMTGAAGGDELRIPGLFGKEGRTLHGATNAAGARLESQGVNGGPSWDYVEKQLRGAHVDQDDIERISHMDVRKRAGEAQRALDKANRKDDLNIHGKHANEVRVKFTGMAEKFFKAIQPMSDNKAGANAGENLRAADFANPKGPGMDKLTGLLGWGD
jgi:hypothetical protein